MTSFRIDAQLILAWQAAHSLARSSPPPVHDRGGFRVDTGSEKEVKRWVFPQLCEGLSEIAQEITAPRHYLKLCGTDTELRAVLPHRWVLQPANYFMIATATALDARPLPQGYRVELQQDGPVSRASIMAADGELAASGCAAESAGAFIYDRIETAPAHRRKGLGAAVMAALGSARKSLAAVPLLVATEDGRSLYANLGWTVLAPFATATIPEQ